MTALNFVPESILPNGQLISSAAATPAQMIRKILKWLSFMQSSFCRQHALTLTIEFSTGDSTVAVSPATGTLVAWDRPPTGKVAKLPCRRLHGLIEN